MPKGLTKWYSWRDPQGRTHTIFVKKGAKFEEIVEDEIIDLRDKIVKMEDLLGKMNRRVALLLRQRKQAGVTDDAGIRKLKLRIARLEHTIKKLKEKEASISKQKTISTPRKSSLLARRRVPLLERRSKLERRVPRIRIARKSCCSDKKKSILSRRSSLLRKKALLRKLKAKIDEYNKCIEKAKKSGVIDDPVAYCKRKLRRRQSISKKRSAIMRRKPIASRIKVEEKEKPSIFPRASRKRKIASRKELLRKRRLAMLRKKAQEQEAKEEVKVEERTEVPAKEEKRTQVDLQSVVKNLISALGISPDALRIKNISVDSDSKLVYITYQVKDEDKVREEVATLDEKKGSLIVRGQEYTYDIPRRIVTPLPPAHPEKVNIARDTEGTEPSSERVFGEEIEEKPKKQAPVFGREEKEKLVQAAIDKMLFKNLITEEEIAPNKEFLRKSSIKDIKSLIEFIDKLSPDASGIMIHEGKIVDLTEVV